MSDLRGRRAAVLRAFGATVSECDELLEYGQNGFRLPEPSLPVALPLPDEPFVESWREWCAEAAQRGAWEVLRAELPQLRFPIGEETRRGEAYRAATRSGVFPPDGDPGLSLRSPRLLTLSVQPSLAGGIGLIVTPDRSDFERLVQALTRHSQPVPVSAAMGACMVGGMVNWRRLRALRQAWEASTEGDRSAAAWRSALRAGSPGPAHYHDRFILATEGPYSGVTGERFGLGAERWRRLSGTIRVEHECTHYLTRRAFGRMSNAVLDELIADYAGIVAAAGKFRSDWLLAFMEHRLPNYRGALSDGAVEILRRLVRAAAGQLAAFDASLPAVRGAGTRWGVLVALAAQTVEELAAGDGAARLSAAYIAASRRANALTATA